MRRAGLLSLIVVALAAPVRADDAALDENTLESRRGEIAKAAAEKHVAVAAKLEKAGAKREAFLELVLALELEPENAPAREKLGYKKEDGHWRGTPDVPAASIKPLEAALAKERDRAHDETAKKLAALALQAKKSGLLAPARRLAGLALDESQDERSAREVLEHEKKGSSWLSPREVRIQAAFTRALEGASAGKEEAGDIDLMKLLDLGDLARRETDHLSLLATKAASVDLAQQGKIAETTWAASDYFLGGRSDGFSVEGEKVDGKPAEPAPPPRLVFVASREHAAFVDRTVLDERKRQLYKKLSGAGAAVGLPSGSVPVFETWIDKDAQSEWTSTTIASYLVHACVQRGAKLPDFIFEGVRRFMSGHASGRAGRSFYGEGSGTLKDRFQGATFAELRAHVREALASSLEGDLRVLLEKNANDLERADAAKALAFIDYCFARERKKLVAFLGSLSTEDLPVNVFEKKLGRSIEEVENDFREFVREEY